MNDTYLVPRSHTPAKDDLYRTLLTLGWRYDSKRVVWLTPEAQSLQGFGALEYAPDLRWARIQPPSRDGVRPEPLIRLERLAEGWAVGWWRNEPE